MVNIICPICFGCSAAFDVVDFNKSCEEVRGKYLPLSLIPVYYYRCRDCEFVHAPEFESWSDGDFIDKIYNNKYIEVDPDYLIERPHLNFHRLNNLFGLDAGDIRHLDWGGGSGELTRLLSEIGWDSVTYDPFSDVNNSISVTDKFDFITAFEVFEHVPNINKLLDNMSYYMKDESLLLFSTAVSDGNIKPNSRLSWWYVSPRNGHISIFSRKSIEILAGQRGFNFGSFGGGLDGFHCFWKKLPAWAGKVIR